MITMLFKMLFMKLYIGMFIIFRVVEGICRRTEIANNLEIPDQYTEDVLKPEPRTKFETDVDDENFCYQTFYIRLCLRGNCIDVASLKIVDLDCAIKSLKGNVNEKGWPFCMAVIH